MISGRNIKYRKKLKEPERSKYMSKPNEYEIYKNSTNINTTNSVLLGIYTYVKLKCMTT